MVAVSALRSALELDSMSLLLLGHREYSGRTTWNDLVEMLKRGWGW